MTPLDGHPELKLICGNVTLVVPAPAVTVPLVDIVYVFTTLTTPDFPLGMLPPTPLRRIENGLEPIDTDVGRAALVLKVVDVSSVVSAHAG